MERSGRVELHCFQRSVQEVLALEGPRFIAKVGKSGHEGYTSLEKGHK